MKKYYRLMSRMLFAVGLGLIFLSSQAYAQKASVSGTIKDTDSGDPIPGVNVVIKGTTTGTVTDIDGNYTITVPANAVLVYSFVGYHTQEVAVGNQTTINLSMEFDVTQLGEVVVIGYGEIKKDDATGSVLSIGKDDFNPGAIGSPSELLLGKAAGVVITSAGGAAGSGQTIRIRGGSSLRANNDPLVVIDGIPLESAGISGMANPLSTINPNDIETFTVLKDASATAIYGSRASNGVIIITTKQGTKGGKMVVSYNGLVSIGVANKRLEVFTGDEYRNLVQDRVDNHGFDAAALNGLGTANTDWQNEIYRNAISTDHNVALSGSIKSTPFRVSVGYTNQNGILKENNMQRTSFTVAATPSLLNDNLVINLNAKGSFIDNNFSNNDAIGSAIRFDPTQSIRNGNTRFGGYTASTELTSGDPINGVPNNIAVHNPVAQLAYRDNTSKAQRYILGAKFDYKMPFLPELKATLNLGYDLYTSDGVDASDTLGSWTYREPENQVREYSQTKKNSLLDFYLSYSKDFNSDNKLDVTGGYSYQHFYNEGENSNRPQNATAGEYLNADTVAYKNENFLVSFFGRVNYTYKDKYLLTATVRNDGSSRFSEDNRWGVFPAVALGWKINEEAFLTNVESLDLLKLRVGWGQTGQQDIGDNFYPYIPTYTISQVGAYYQFGGNFYPTQRPDAYDANIKWETTTTLNLGLDYSFYNGRLTGFIDVYKRTTEDLLNEVPIPAGTNFSNFLTTNVGSLENKGIELGITGVLVSKEDLSWEVSGNLTYNQNEITKLTLVNDPDYPGYNTGGISGGVGNNVQINGVGHAANTFYLFSQVFDQNGMPIEGLYVDKTGEGGNVAGNELNKFYLKNPAPDFLIGLSSRVNYKNFDFSFSGRINLNNYVYNNNASSMALYQNLYNQSGFNANILTDVRKTEFTIAQYWSDVYLENASFFRMDNISLGYSFDKLLTEKLNGRLAFTVQNAFVITKYSGLDPEVSGGIDNNIYPRPTTYMLGLNLNF